jgi:flagellar biosynthesis protein FlhG
MLTSLTTPSEKRYAGGDQARGLRSLVARQTLSAHEPSVKSCHTIVVSGGKGGVGRSVIALNLAITLAQRGDAVGLLDASPDFGNIELLCGLNGYWNLSHVAQGSRQLDEVLVHGPVGVCILSGANCLIDPSRIPARTFDQLLNFERRLDWLIVDASGGASSSTREFAIAADDLLIVTTPESTAIAEAYATVKSLATSTRPRLGLLVNQADSANQAQRILDRLQQTAHALLQIDLHRRGYIPRDAAIPVSVNARQPFVLESPTSTATSALQMLTQRWTRPPRSDGDLSFFARLQKRGTTTLN